METNEEALERGEQKKRPDEEDWWPYFIQSCCKTETDGRNYDGGWNKGVYSLINAGES